jgi:hypothetical protein
VVGEPAQRGVLEFEVIRSFSGSGELEDERLPARRMASSLLRVGRCAWSVTGV